MKHLFNIIGLLLVLAAIARDYFPIDSTKHKNYFLTIILILAFSSFLVQTYIDWSQYRSDRKKEESQRWSGYLESPTISNQKYPVLALGGGPSRLMYTGPSDQPAFKLPRDRIFIKLVDGKARLTMNVRNKAGNLLVAIEDNHWLCARPPQIFDRNFNENALEIIDAKGEPVFQVEIVGEEVRLAFITHDSNIGFAPWLHEVRGFKSTLFKYPSTEHLGVLNKP